MLAAQVELNSGVDLVLVRIREATLSGTEAANAALVDPGAARRRAANERFEESPIPALLWGLEHALFAVTLAAIGCMEVLALLARAA
jgi:hypothetical protein